MAKTVTGAPPAEYKDYYKTPGVDKAASAKEIKKAYRKLVRNYNPDVSKAKDAESKTKEINEAYSVLEDAEKSAAYDALGSGAGKGQPFEPPPDWAQQFHFGEGAGSGHDDFFSDLFAHVGRRARAGQQFNPDPHYRFECRNVYEDVGVAPWEAALGAQIDVATLSGQVQVSVPAGSQSGRKLRLKGRGIPGHPPGDLFLVLEVVLQPATSVKARELYRTMGRELAFNPRAGAWRLRAVAGSARKVRAAATAASERHKNPLTVQCFDYATCTGLIVDQSQRIGTESTLLIRKAIGFRPASRCPALLMCIYSTLRRQCDGSTLNFLPIVPSISRLGSSRAPASRQSS